MDRAFPVAGVGAVAPGTGGPAKPAAARSAAVFSRFMPPPPVSESFLLPLQSACALALADTGSLAQSRAETGYGAARGVIEP